MSADVTLIYYSHGIREPIRSAVLDSLNVVADNRGADRIMVVPVPLLIPAATGWQQILLDRDDRGPGTDQDSRILAGCRAATTRYIALVEHDVMYPADYLANADLSRCNGHDWLYDVNTWRVNADGAWPLNRTLTSCVCGLTDDAVMHFRERLKLRARGERIVWDEPGGDIEYSGDMLRYFGASPVLDLRWGGNMTGSRDARHYETTIPYWGDHSDLWRRVVTGE